MLAFITIFGFVGITTALARIAAAALLTVVAHADLLGGATRQTAVDE
jgi:hypothetical protein